MTTATRSIALAALAALAAACSQRTGVGVGGDLGDWLGNDLGVGVGGDLGDWLGNGDLALPTGWTAQPSGTTRDLLGVWGSSGADVFVVGRAGTILRSTGDGAWHAETSGTTKDLYAVWGASATDLWVAGDGVVLRSTGDGSWRAETLPTNAAWQAVWGSGAGDVYVAGIIGVAHTTGDGSWTTPPPDSMTLGWFGIGGRGASDVWLVGGNGTGIQGQGAGGFDRYDGAWHWTPLDTLFNLKGVAFTARGTFLVGNTGQIWADGGSGFAKQTSGVPDDLNAVWAAGDGTLFAVGGSGSVVTSAGDGVWTRQPTPSALPLAAVWGASAHDVYAVGMAGELLHRN